jgi:hypothetical protein
MEEMGEPPENISRGDLSSTTVMATSLEYPIRSGH